MNRSLRKLAAGVCLFAGMVLFFSGCTSGKEALRSAQDSPSTKVEEKKENAQPSATPAKEAPKPDSGLLLGVSRELDAKIPVLGLKGSEYRTIWIYPEGEKLSFFEKKGMIITPFKDKFFRLENDVFTMKQIRQGVKETTGYLFDDYQSYYDFTGIAAFDVKAKSQALMTPEYFRNTYLHEEEGYLGESFKERMERLLYVGNRYACISYDYVETGGGSYSSSSGDIQWFEIGDLQSVERKDRSKEILDLLGQDIKSGIEKQKSSFKGKNETEGLIKTEEKLDGRTVAIERREGRSRLELPVYLQYMHDGNGSNTNNITRYVELDGDIPKEITSFDDLCLPWKEIIKKIPFAKDAVSSPNKDLLAVLTPFEILVFEHPEKGLDKPVLRVRAESSEKIILSQWATGSYVKKWTEMLK